MLGVNLIGYFGKGFGLGESSRLMTQTLKHAGIPFTLISANDLLSNLKDEPFTYPIDNVFKYPVNLFTIDSTAIIAVIQRHGWDQFKNRYNIGLVFWETTESNQEHFNGWRCLNEIWTTSRFMQEILSRIAPVPVHHFPQPLELNYPNKITSKSDAGIPNRFTFLFFFSFKSVLGRKNPQALIDAFQIAFPDNKDVQLIIKSKDSCLYPEQLQMMQTRIKDDPRLIWIDQIMDEQGRFDLMNSSDCYVSLHRSEGLGLTMAEAMLLGKPVIGTAYSGNMDFMNEDNSYLCSYRITPVGEGNNPYPPHGLWAEPDIHHAAQLMRKVVENREEALGKAYKGKDFIQKHHSFKQVGALMTKRLESIKPLIKANGKPWPYIKAESYQKILKIYHTTRKNLKPIKTALKQLRKWT